MTHTYQLTGMTCSGCEAKVKSKLTSLPLVSEVMVSKDNNTATITTTKHISLSELQNAIGGTESKYQIRSISLAKAVEKTESWLMTYKPLLIIFAFITGISILTSQSNYHIQWMYLMRNFMAGFFLTFSFFKLLNIKAFAETYSMYDIVAMRIKFYGLVYPFIELALGIAFLIDFYPIATNLVTLVMMSVSIIGVLQSILNKKKIQCACLGSVFNLPMSTVTIIEDAIMIIMSAAMLIMSNS